MLRILQRKSPTGRQTSPCRSTARLPMLSTGQNCTLRPWPTPLASCL